MSTFYRLVSHPHAFKAYAATTLSYGLVRKGIEMKGATVSHYDSKSRDYIRIPILTCDKVMITAVCAGATLYLWPLYLYKDFKKLEIKFNKDLKPEWYESTLDNKYLIDYFYS
jgi:hypothetical protein